jgi:hypothetical protein
MIVRNWTTSQILLIIWSEDLKDSRLQLSEIFLKLFKPSEMKTVIH